MTIDAFQTLAFDRATCRAFDQDGHLHVDSANISKACINPYLGSEIPDGDRLGLHPDKTYRLLRDPKELEKAAGSFNGKPLLFTHKPITSLDHDFEGTVGAVTSVKYEHPYLKAALDVWPGDAIDAIKSGEQKQLSSAYRYQADMTPGEYEGEPYDGVMRDIAGNHVALVKEGRAGPDVVVGDELPHSLRGTTMTKTVLSRKAVAAQGALVAYLAPKMAQDKKIDWTPMLKDVTAENYKAKTKAIAADVMKQITGKLAQDENVDLKEIAAIIEAVADVTPTEPDPVDPVEPATDGDDTDLIAMLVAKGYSEEEAKAIAAKATPSDPVVGDESEEEKAKKADEDKKAMDAKLKELAKGMVSKTAMDAAVSAATKIATDNAIKIQREIRDAERVVEADSRVGRISVACDSADDVYRAALQVMNIDVQALPSGTARAVYEAIPKVSSTHHVPAHIAQDANQATEYAKQFPNATRLKH